MNTILWLLLFDAYYQVPFQAPEANWKNFGEAGIRAEMSLTSKVNVGLEFGRKTEIFTPPLISSSNYSQKKANNAGVFRLSYHPVRNEKIDLYAAAGLGIALQRTINENAALSLAEQDVRKSAFAYQGTAGLRFYPLKKVGLVVEGGYKSYLGAMLNTGVSVKL